jgi:hypothetical protein
MLGGETAMQRPFRDHADPGRQVSSGQNTSPVRAAMSGGTAPAVKQMPPLSASLLTTGRQVRVPISPASVDFPLPGGPLTMTSRGRSRSRGRPAAGMLTPTFDKNPPESISPCRVAAMFVLWRIRPHRTSRRPALAR